VSTGAQVSHDEMLALRVSGRPVPVAAVPAHLHRIQDHHPLGDPLAELRQKIPDAPLVDHDHREGQSSDELSRPGHQPS
jgi:hypothetical protein